ncbi:MAG: hypothetical protein H3C28_01860 [Sphingomonadales bacterium]|nr:hypothetical protein [Sphingomonadales bacterium]
MTKPSHDKANSATAYQTGYGKPPAGHRFQKGQSGNPKGRPKKQLSTPKPLKLADVPSNSQFEHEIYRLLKLQENGQPVELPASQAVMRSMIAGALKGSRLAQKQVYEIMKAGEAAATKERERIYEHYERLKQLGEAQIAKAKQQGLPEPELYPHPKDILLDPVGWKVRVVGPHVPEHKQIYQRVLLHREYWLGHSIHRELTGRAIIIPVNGRQQCLSLTMYIFLDQSLPPSLRHDDATLIERIRAWHNMTKKERIRRLDEILEEIDGLPEIYLSPIESYEQRRKNLFTILQAMGDTADKALALIENKAKKCAK